MSCVHAAHAYGLYIHIPFCASKCLYCDFLSFGAENFPANAAALCEAGGYADAHEAYTRALLAEMRHARLNDPVGVKIDTVYIGGGTPTALAASFLCEILTEAQKFDMIAYQKNADVEVTVECNPDTISADPARYLAALRAAGANRLSIGLQAWQDTLLARIGRRHTSADFMRTFRAARAVGFDNINVDLMFSLPGQTMAAWRESLHRVAELRPEHISAYALTPAENTPLWDMLENAPPNGANNALHPPLTLPDDETDRAMYYEAIRILTAAGYTRYEISNFALPRRESRHNLNTWQRKPYRGFGPGAHSFEKGALNCNAPNATPPTDTRWHNTEDVDKYLRVWAGGAEAGQARENRTVLTSAEALSEAIILGLRLTKGISEAEINAAHHTNLRARYGNEIDRLAAEGLLTQKNGRLYLTTKGTDLANQVMTAFI